jgi:TIR domain-containing protein
MNEPKVFISYSRDDGEWVHQFAEALRAREIQVWLDDWQIRLGESFTDAIEAGLRSSDVIVSVLTRANAQEPNVAFELGAALSMGKLVIPIIPTDIDRSAIPSAFLTRRYVMRGEPGEAAREVAEALKQRAA